MELFQNFCMARKRNLLAYISIWTIAAIVLTISLTVFKGALFGIIYLLFFLTFVLLFQSSVSLWARFIECYCILLILYSTALSILIYSFQYKTVSDFFKELLTEEVLTDIGLVVRNQTWLLFLEPIVPLFLTMSLVIYLRVFHHDFNRVAYSAGENDTSVKEPLNDAQVGSRQTNNYSTITPSATTSLNQDLNSQLGDQEQASRAPSAANVSLKNVKRTSRRVKIRKFLSAAIECFWRILETHFVKLVAFMIFRLAIVDVCLMNLPFLVIVLFALKYPKASKCSCLTASWLISIIVVIRNLANLKTLRPYDINDTCSETAPPPLNGQTYSYLEYLGLSLGVGNPLNQVDEHLIVLVLITIFSFICIHYERRPLKDYELSFGVIFTGVGRREAEAGMISTFKYFCNFGFYKFGIEITCLALVIAISNRLDSTAAIYGIILILLGITTSKRTLASIWPFLTLIVCLLIPTQYILRLGLPKPLCRPYPWASLSEDVKHWLFLPDYLMTQNAKLLLYDFLVLLAFCRQGVVFKLMRLNSNPSFITDCESRHELSAKKFREKYLPSDDEFCPEDCFSNYTTQTNYLKSIFFKSIYWITLTVVLLAGATKVSLFSLGYLIGCFIFLWLGNDAYLMPLRRLLYSWNWFIFYSTLVVFIKVILQFYTCYLHEYLLNHCYILQILRVVCYRKINEPQSSGSMAACVKTLPKDELDILWDGVCLLFLIMQRVVFGTQYFRCLVREVKAQQILASRGAELIMATQVEEAKAHSLYEREVMKSIRERLDNLKSDREETAKAWERLLEFPHHHQIIRNANKHLFSIVTDEPITQMRSDDWKFKRAFIPDPIGDELERMNEINGISAVFTRWMKGKPLYGNGSPEDSNSPNSEPQERSSAEPARDVNETINNFPKLEIERRSSQDEPISRDSADAIQSEGKEQSEEVLSSFDDIHEDESSKPGRIRDCWDMLALLTYSILLSATVELNKLSRSYRYVSRRMAVEKNALKRQFDLDDERFKKDPKWRKWVISTLSDTYTRTNEEQGGLSNTSLNRIRSALRVIASNAGSSQDSNQSVDTTRSPTSSQRPHNKTELTDPEYHFLKLNMFTQFCRALVYVFVSNTSLICQLIIIINQVLTASLLSLPLPLLTFLWGTLSVPRPTKRFWKSIITYTEMVIVIKYVFQFPIWEFEINNVNPFYYPNLLGIKNITILYDLFLLLSLFFHRSMLKSLGQWYSSTQQQEAVLIVEAPDSKDGFNNNQEQYIIDIEKDQSSRQDSSEMKNGLNNRRLDLVNYEHNQKPKPRFDKTHKLQENIDRSIELAPRVEGSSEVDQTALSEECLQDSYQNQVYDTTAKLELENVGETEQHQDWTANQSKASCCSFCVKAYNRTRRSISLFFQHVLNTPHKVEADVYTWMFLCDFINILILIYGFWAFGSGYTNQTVASFFGENRIPFSVLILLLVAIIMDRSFYLQKNIGRKLMFHIILVIGIHFWLFFSLPFTTGHTLTLKEYWLPKAWYIIKCIYFLLSAHQIRSGYPRRVLGNCFTKSFGLANWTAFTIYKAIPLVYDLRLYMDWIWTETTLEFRNWSLMEDMFSNLFIRKCQLTIESEYPSPRARPLKRLPKYITGGTFIVLILAIIWGPLLFFSAGKTVGESNLPVEMEFELEFVGFQPILKLRATAQQIMIINDQQYSSLKARFLSLSSQGFFGDYKVGDVTAIRLEGQSNAIWEISPPSKELLMRNVLNDTLILKSTWTLYRIKKEKSQNIDVNIAGSYQTVIPLTGNTTEETQFRISLLDMLTNSSTTATLSNTKHVITPPIFPNYVKVPETGVVSLVEFKENSNLLEYQPLRALNLTYIRMFDNGAQQIDKSTSWWKADDLCKYNPVNDSYPFWSTDILDHCNSLVVVAFNDRIFTGILAFLSAQGIIGLYTTVVVFFARLIRSEPAGKVIYTEIPKVDRIYGLIMDIYMMRECGEFELEEKLFAKLLYLYRSPEMLIEWSQ